MKEKTSEYHEKKGYSKTAEDRVLHVYSKDFSSIQASFAAVEEICDMDDQYLFSEVGREGAHLCILNPDTIVFVTEYYDGVLYSFIRKNGVWETRKFFGDKPGIKNR